MKDEIIAGLKNALARGQTLEQAANSFVNAGYNPAEVKAAYQEISSGASSITAPMQPTFGSNSPSPIASESAPVQQFPAAHESTAKSGGGAGLLIAIIVIAMLVLLGAIGYFFYALYLK